MNACGVALRDASPVIRLAGADLMPDSRCPGCQATTADPVWPTREPQEFTLHRCRHCRLVFTVPQLSQDELRALYTAPYYEKRTLRFGALIERAVSWSRRRLADTICRLGPPGRVLEIGCGRGEILRMLRQRGWTVTGLELNEAAARRARDLLGSDVVVGPYQPDRFPAGAFDAVILWHVLEHLVNPSRVIADLARLVRPGGFVAIAVPNIESWQAAVTREHWLHLDVPRHTVHFSEAWLRTALKAAGFRVGEVNQFSFEFSAFGWIQSLLNCWITPQNLLYEMLKRPSARYLPKPFRTYPVQSVVSAVALGLLLVPACLLTAVEALARRGATIELFACKETR